METGTESFVAPIGEEIVNITILREGGYRVAFMDRRTRTLYHTHDENQDSDWYFEDESDHDTALELGEIIEHYLIHRTTP